MEKLWWDYDEYRDDSVYLEAGAYRIVAEKDPDSYGYRAVVGSDDEILGSRGNLRTLEDAKVNAVLLLLQVVKELREKLVEVLNESDGGKNHGN